MENQAERPKRGGKREGAGRKKSGVTKTTTTFSLDPDLLAQLNLQPNRSRFINEAIREKLQRQEKAI